VEYLLLRRALKPVEGVGRCFLFLREGAGASEDERQRQEKDGEKEREKGRASSFNYLWRPFEAGVPPSFVFPSA